ncbi:hypothetical protein HHX47_DHR9000435 [Lentinula edodes]|nr:hypothetical protein HHX47_DHR9000435 [Lentinula edodes]
MRSTVIGLAVGLWASTTNAHLAVFTKGMWCLNCNNQPPADGDILTLPAGESITVEIAANQGVTTLSFDGQYVSDWPDGHTYADDYSDVADVTPENLVVFSVTYKWVSYKMLHIFVLISFTGSTPWKRLTTYEVPANMPACPEGGCICAWGWVRYNKHHGHDVKTNRTVKRRDE